MVVFFILSSFRFLTVINIRHRPGYALLKNPKLLEMKNEEIYLDFLIPKTWKFLKHFARQFH